MINTSIYYKALRFDKTYVIVNEIKAVVHQYSHWLSLQLLVLQL